MSDPEGIIAKEAGRGVGRVPVSLTPLELPAPGVVPSRPPKADQVSIEQRVAAWLGVSDEMGSDGWAAYSPTTEALVRDLLAAYREERERTEAAERRLSTLTNEIYHTLREAAEKVYEHYSNAVKGDEASE